VSALLRAEDLTKLVSQIPIEMIVRILKIDPAIVFLRRTMFDKIVMIRLVSSVLEIIQQPFIVAVVC